MSFDISPIGHAGGKSPILGYIMGPFEALKRLFFSSVEGYSRVGDAFVQLDVDALADRLRLQERGAEDGELCIPDATATTLGLVETDIISTIDEFHQAAQVDLRNQLQAYEGRLGALQLLHQTGSIKSHAVQAAGDFGTLVAEGKNRTDLDRRELRDAFKDLQAFKAANGIVGPARDAPPKVVTYGVIALAGILEVLVNAAFLRVNDDLGYLGGIIGAIVVSAINIVLAFLFGRLFIPRRNLPDQTNKLIGNGALVVWVILAGTWNLLAAHYRDAKFNGLEAPEIAALRQLGSEPFMLDGIFSLGIFIIGVFVSVIVLFDALKMDDPIPGYGDKSREFRARSEVYSDKIADLNEQLTGVRDEAIEGANAVKDELALQLGERERIQRAYERYAERFRAHEQHLENVLNQLLAIYRTTNRRARGTTGPVPAYFDDRLELRKSKIHPPYVQPINESDIQEARAALDRCIEEVDRAFHDSLAQFPTVDQIISEIEHG